MLVGEVDEVGSGEAGGELALEHSCVFLAEAEGDEVAYVAEDGFEDALVLDLLRPLSRD